MKPAWPMLVLGYNKAAARAAHYLQTGKVRVSLVSMTSSATPISVSADPRKLRRADPA